MTQELKGLQICHGAQDTTTSLALTEPPADTFLRQIYPFCASENVSYLFPLLFSPLYINQVTVFPKTLHVSPRLHQCPPNRG